MGKVFESDCYSCENFGGTNTVPSTVPDGIPRVFPICLAMPFASDMVSTGDGEILNCPLARKEKK